jgi:hypothetical protein
MRTNDVTIFPQQSDLLLAKIAISIKLTCGHIEERRDTELSQQWPDILEVIGGSIIEGEDDSMLRIILRLREHARVENR